MLRFVSMISLNEDTYILVIVNSRFIERPQKRSRGNQLIHRRLTKTKLIGSSQDPENQAGRESDGYGGWCFEFRRGRRYEEDEVESYGITLGNDLSQNHKVHHI